MRKTSQKSRTSIWIFLINKINNINEWWKDCDFNSLLSSAKLKMTDGNEA